MWIAIGFAILLSYVSGMTPHIIQIVADDLGYDDLGHNSIMGNNGKSITPNINHLMDTGIVLQDYYTFKVCSPTRSSLLTGRYPWGAGFYDMSDDFNHCTSQFTLLPELLRRANYSTHALGKWDVGYITKDCTATYSGFDTFLGYYSACLSDYWYHWCPNQCDEKGPYVDLSNSTTNKPTPSSLRLNGTYNAHIFTQEAIRIIKNHNPSKPLYLYLAYQNAHLACGNSPTNVAVDSGKKYGLQAPCETVDLYTNTINDTVKVQGAMVTELDYGIGNVTAALKNNGMWDNTVLFMVSDNGAPLNHGYNSPLRGGKHTFWEGGVRVVSFMNSPLLPTERRGTVFSGLAHSSDWYTTLVEGIAGSTIPKNTGPRPPDGLNLWPALVNGSDSPRHEVVHQVANAYFDENGNSYDINGTKICSGNCDGSCGQAIRVGKWKMILGNPGDNHFLKWPKLGNSTTPFGSSGGYRERGTNHCRAKDEHTRQFNGTGVRLFDLENDLTESNNLAALPEHADRITLMKKKLKEYGKTGPPPAYVFPKRKDMKKAKEKVCNWMQKEGFLEPSDIDGILLS